MRNSGSFCVGQVPGSHVATRAKKHTCERRICPSLSRPFAAGPASSLFVVVQSVLDVTRIPGTTVAASPVFFPLFFVFFCRLVLKKKCQVLEQIMLLLLAVLFLLKFLLFFAFLSQPKCMHQGRMVIVSYQRSSLSPKITWLYSYIHTRSPSGVVNCSQGVMQEKCITMEKAFAR